MSISIQDVNKNIDEFKKCGMNPETLAIGYSTYAHLLNEEKCADEISRDNKDPMIRYCKGIKLKSYYQKTLFCSEIATIDFRQDTVKY